ncbi:MAG: flavodoxin family protein [Chloroflexi bacterium]|nr:flavodoxin family protein [Chloroflexota bacterium]
MTLSVLGIAGSTRRGGNTEALLDRALEGARDAGASVEKVVLLDLRISPCICPQSEDCLLTGICTVIDDMQPLYAKLRAVDLVFLAAPVAFRGVPAQAKALIDRTQALWVAKHLLKRPLRESPGAGKGLFIGVADSDNPKEFTGTRLTVRSWFVSFQFRQEAETTYASMSRKGDVHKYPEALQQAYEVGARLVRESLSAPVP